MLENTLDSKESKVLLYYFIKKNRYIHSCNLMETNTLVVVGCCPTIIVLPKKSILNFYIYVYTQAKSFIKIVRAIF